MTNETFSDRLKLAMQVLNVSVGYSRVKDDMIQISENYSEENPTISLMKVVNTESYDRMTASLTVAPTIRRCRHPVQL